MQAQHELFPQGKFQSVRYRVVSHSLTVTQQFDEVMDFRSLALPVLSAANILVDRLRHLIHLSHHSVFARFFL